MKSRVLSVCAMLVAAMFLAGAAFANSGTSTKPVHVKPGTTYTEPDGSGTVTNSPSSTDDVIVEETWTDDKFVSARVIVKKGVLATGKDLDKDKVDADGGKVKLDDCDGSDIKIKNGGGVDCKDCDDNNIDFDGSGTLTGSDDAGRGNNNNNDVDLNNHSGAKVNKFDGKNNNIHN